MYGAGEPGEPGPGDQRGLKLLTSEAVDGEKRAPPGVISDPNPGDHTV